MNIYFINPPFKAEFGKFSRESRSPAITKSGALYYPLWLIYAALYSRKHGHDIRFLDAPAKQLDEEQSLEIIQKADNARTLFVLISDDNSVDNTRSIIQSYNDKKIRYVLNSGKKGVTHNFENALRHSKAQISDICHNTIIN